jgi:hypothetical protein
VSIAAISSDVLIDISVYVNVGSGEAHDFYIHDAFLVTGSTQGVAAVGVSCD